MSLKFGWDFIKALKPAKYKYIKDKEQNIETIHFGVMAQDIDKYLKGVSKEEFAILTKDKNDKFMVNYIELIAPMISTIQELQKRVESLENAPSPYDTYSDKSLKTDIKDIA